MNSCEEVGEVWGAERIGEKDVGRMRNESLEAGWTGRGGLGRVV